MQAELAAIQEWTREQSVKALVEIVYGGNKAAEVIAAVKELNAMHGYNAPTKHELTGKDRKDLVPELTDNERAAKIAGLLALAVD